jgi:hypothetical protein
MPEAINSDLQSVEMENLTAEGLKEYQQSIKEKQQKLDELCEQRFGILLRSLNIEFSHISIFTDADYGHDGYCRCDKPSFAVKPPDRLSEPSTPEDIEDLLKWIVDTKTILSESFHGSEPFHGNACQAYTDIPSKYKDLTTKYEELRKLNDSDIFMDEWPNKFFNHHDQLNTGSNFVVIYDVDYSNLDKAKSAATEVRGEVSDALESEK